MIDYQHAVRPKCVAQPKLHHATGRSLGTQTHVADVKDMVDREALLLGYPVSRLFSIWFSMVEHDQYRYSFECMLKTFLDTMGHILAYL